MTAEALAADPGSAAGRLATETRLRVGVDVGGTFTKAVAVDPWPFRLAAEAVVATSHGHQAGVMHGVAKALRLLLAELGPDRERIDLVAFSTTQAMNALLEGDVPRVGVIGMGAKPNLRKARKRTHVGEIALAPGRVLETEHVFLDVGSGLDPGELDPALAQLRDRGCGSVAISAAFAVESPELELAVAERAAELGLPACCGHQLSEAYGLETRTVSAAINAAVLPVVARTGGLVQEALAEAQLEVPLLVLRGDGGAMSVDSFRARPSMTVGSGPAAGVAAALHQAKAHDAVVVECGGTSTNVSVVCGGRPALRSIKVMGRPTAIRSIDSWVVGMAGGSMIRIGRRGIAGVGPRSAHLAGLPYACFAEPADLEGARAVPIAPRPGDPEYVAIDARGGRYALTATCAANALGLVGAGSHAAGSRRAAEAGFAALAELLGRGDGEALSRAVLDAGVAQIRISVEEALRSHELGADTPLIALGGSGTAFVPELARSLGLRHLEPEHPEILASIGAAMTLIRVEVARSSTREAVTERRLEAIEAAERACVDAGAAPGTVAVETTFDTAENVVRAVATGAVALEAGAVGRSPTPEADQADIAARALAVDRAAVEALWRSDFYAAYAERGRNGDGTVVIVDRLGSVPIVESSKRIVVGGAADFIPRLERAIEEASLNLGIASLIPRVTIACGPRLLDLSDSRRAEELLASARAALAEQRGEAIAVIAR